MTLEELDAMWADPENWKSGICYYNPKDPRIIVPKRWRWGGWTFNFYYKKECVAYLLLAIAVVDGPIFLIAFLFGFTPWGFLISFVLSVALLIAWAKTETNRFVDYTQDEIS